MSDSAARGQTVVGQAPAVDVQGGDAAHLHVPIALRWSDLDAYGHVNNVAIAGILEEARIRALWRAPLGTDGAYPSAVVDGWPGGDTATLVATQAIEYQMPMPYRTGPVDVELWISAIGGASIDVNYRVEGFITAFTVIVLADAVTHKPRRVRPEEKAAWLPYLDAKLPFRR